MDKSNLTVNLRDKRYCEIGYCNRPADDCHIVARGTGYNGCDCEVNRYNACRKHHGEQHAIGVKTFFKKHFMWDRYLVAVQHNELKNQGKVKCET